VRFQPQIAPKVLKTLGRKGPPMFTVLSFMQEHRTHVKWLTRSTGVVLLLVATLVPNVSALAMEWCDMC
jgi:hypothetical protein